jgi:quercetin dioxygenase-like cupin family protein
MVDTPEVELGITEARTREDVNYTGFVFDFDVARASDTTPNGMIQPNQVNSNPFLSTLPGDGNGQTLVTLGPCAGNTPHNHPRGSEISFVLYGSMQFGMVEENSAKNTLILRNITQNETIHVPQGVLHFSHNPNCQPAAFLANFATKDPGTQTMFASLMQVPTNILHSATGIPEVTINLLKTYPLVTAPGTGGEECLKRCNLTFAEANHLYPNPAAALINTASLPPAAG